MKVLVLMRLRKLITTRFLMTQLSLQADLYNKQPFTWF